MKCNQSGDGIGANKNDGEESFIDNNAGKRALFQGKSFRDFLGGGASMGLSRKQRI